MADNKHEGKKTIDEAGNFSPQSSVNNFVLSVHVLLHY